VDGGLKVDWQGVITALVVALCAAYSAWRLLLPRAWRARLSARLRGVPLSATTGDAQAHACGGCSGCGGGGLGRITCATDAAQAKVIRIVRPGDPS
jgi:hypothetical protein